MEIQETTFTPKQYLTLKKTISTDQITDKEMYMQAGQKLGAYMAQHTIKPTGPWSVIYFTWDEANKKADIGISFPVSGIETVDDAELSIVTIPESKAAMKTLQGSYDGLGTTHQALMTYAKEHGYTTDGVLAIEEYVVSPMQDENPENWKTDIYYLHN